MFKISFHYRMILNTTGHLRHAGNDAVVEISDLQKQQLVDKYNKVLKRSFKSTKPKVRMQKHPHA